MATSRKIVDGCTAATYIAYAMSDAATIYPISPASDMGELADQWAVDGRKNLMGQTMVVHEMESELGAAGAVHGCLSGGALTTTFTASQGLMLMIPNMYKIAGELLPAVFHVTSRSISAHALSIFGDHQDVMACRHTGFAFLASSSVQECMDLALVAHLSAIDSSVPFCHFMDGMRTSSELQNIEMIDYEDIRPLVDWDKVNAFRARSMNSENPNMRGTAQNPDVYFQNKEASNSFHLATPAIVESNMKKVGQLTGRQYNLFDYVGAPDAEYVILTMGSSCNVVEEVVEYLLKQNQKVGLVKVRLYRPFSVEHLLAALPKSVKILSVLDRTKEPGAQGEPLFQDICTAIQTNDLKVKVLGGRYGLSSKDFTPSMVKAVFDNMQSAKLIPIFTIGINDDVTHLSLSINEVIDPVPQSTIQCKFYGFGSDGTISANEQAARIIGENTNMHIQAYFSHDSKKSGGYTVSHLRFGIDPILSSYLIMRANYVACHKCSYVKEFDMLEDIIPGGTFVLNSAWTLADMEKRLPAQMRRTIAQKGLKFYNIDAMKVAAEVGLGVRINMIMQAVFFKLANIIDYDKAITLLKSDIQRIYAKEGQAVIDKDWKSLDSAIAELIQINYPDAWKDAKDDPQKPVIEPDFIRYVSKPILAMKGDDLPVSKFSPDGFVPVGTTAYEKRGVAYQIPYWDIDKCIQCTQCSFVCPHAAIRPYLPTKDEMNGAPNTFTTKAATGGPAFKDLSYRIQVYPDDCLGCGSCINVCPAKALSFKLYSDEVDEQRINLEFAQLHISMKDGLLPRNSIKGSQLFQPLLEFSGACAGCGETPYVKLVTQLFGERMLIANATGCSSIWGASMPSMPFTKNKNGHGPAWGNSLFEDNAEYGYGIATAVKQRRARLELLVDEALTMKDLPVDIQQALNAWKAAKDDPDQSYALGQKVLSAIKDVVDNSIFNEMRNNADMFGRKSVWIIGGDGWAYDIGFAGLDHVLASGENVNILVLDTECYSNTGGQTSKATPLGAIAKFSSAGKRTNKKELGRMMMTYGNVYVASIAIGANKQHAINALCEAEAYEGPSIVIAYCPCINQGLRAGMGTSILEEGYAVACGYWALYRFNPDLTKAGKDPLSVDYKQPDGTMPTFLAGEDRYAALTQMMPDEAKELHAELQQDCDELYKILNESKDVY